jgi:hypothetical protein
MKTLVRTFFSTSLLVVAFTFGVAAQTDPNRVRYEQAMYDYFGRSPYFAIPIFLSGERASGDTLKIGLYSLYSPRKLCYPSLGKPHLADSNLSKQQQTDGTVIAGAGRIGLKKIVSAAADAKYDRISKFMVAFADVKVDETAEYYLKTKVNYTNCSFLKDIIEGHASNSDLVLINFVVHGKSEFTIVLEKKLGGAADVGMVKNSFARLFGSAKVEANADTRTHSSLKVTADKSAPIAFRPVFVSLDDVLLREKQIKEGIGKALDEIWKKKDVRAAKQLLEKRSDLNLPPEKLLARMFTGKLTEFNPLKVARDQRYMNIVTSHVLVSSLVYGRIELPR